MRIVKTETKVYKYEELSDDAKQTALEKLSDINVDYEWWEFTYEDAKTVLLKLESFDIDRNRHCTGGFIEAADDTANAIIAEHGESCETFQTATNYLEERRKLVEKHSDGIKTDEVAEDNEYDFDNECEDLDDEFLRSILEDYSIMLQHEFEYLTSEESILETIEVNEYEFTKDGELS